MSEMFVKESAHKLIDKLPNNATWKDLIHQIYVRKIIENGLELYKTINVFRFITVKIVLFC